MAEHDGIVGGDGAEGVVIGIAQHVLCEGLRPFFLMPTPSNNPFTGFGGFSFFGHHLYNLVPAFGFHEIEVEQALPQSGEVAMPFDEARHSKLTGEVGDLCFICAEGFYLLVAAHPQDAVAFDCDGLGPGLSWVNGIDDTVFEDEVCAFLFLLRTSGEQRERTERGDGLDA